MASYGHAKEDLLTRLRKIEGQVRGIQRMIDEDKYCVDILIQISAVRSALDKVGLMLLEHHTRGCVVRALREGGGDADSAVSELTDVMRRFIR